MKRLPFVLALVLASLARFDGLSSPDAAAQTTTAADGTARAVTAANAFLATLSPAERSKVLLDLRPDLKARWSNLPTGTVMQVDRERSKTPLPRNGLRLGDLSAAQRDAVQALLLFNIGNSELTASELRSRGYYLGSNVSYNLKKLVDLGLMNHQRSRVDRRSVRISLTEKGTEIARTVSELYDRHIGSIEQVGGIGQDEFERMNKLMQRLDRFWNEFAGDPSKIDEATRRHYAAIYAGPGAMHSAFAQFLAIGQKDEADNLKAMETKLAMPVLAIGAAKAFGANVAVVMRNAATNVQELVVPNGGHWLMEEAPAATIAAVQDFLAAH